MFKKTRISSLPLAWLQLVHQKNRLIVALAGIAFAVFLLFMQRRTPVFSL